MSSLETSLVWTAIRADAIESFRGQTPRPDDEATIIELFEQQPQLVQRAIEEIAAALAQGRITWAWSALRARLERGAQAIREASVDVTTERSKRVKNAETWLENAGCLYDLERHVEAELFGDPELGTSGLLQAYADDADLRARMLAKWRELRPRGEAAELEHEQRLAAKVERDRQNAERARELARQTLEELTAKQLGD